MRNFDPEKFARYHYRRRRESAVRPGWKHAAYSHDAVIASFTLRWYPLCMFWPMPVSISDIRYPSMGHALFAAAVEPSLPLADYFRHEIASMPQRCQVYRAMNGKHDSRLVIRKDWDEVRLPIAESLLAQKALRSEEFVSVLRASNRAKLIWRNSQKDTFFGVYGDDEEGENHLGKLLMSLRDRIR